MWRTAVLIEIFKGLDNSWRILNISLKYVIPVEYHGMSKNIICQDEKMCFQ